MKKFLKLMILLSVLVLCLTSCESLQKTPDPVIIQVPQPELNLDIPYPPMDKNEYNWEIVVEGNETYFLLPIDAFTRIYEYILTVEHERQKFVAWKNLIKGDSKE